MILVILGWSAERVNAGAFCEPGTLLAFSGSDQHQLLIDIKATLLDLLFPRSS